MEEIRMEWDLWMLEEEAERRVSDLNIYKQLYPRRREYIAELHKIVDLLPLKVPRAVAPNEWQRKGISRRRGNGLGI